MLQSYLAFVQTLNNLSATLNGHAFLVFLLHKAWNDCIFTCICTLTNLSNQVRSNSEFYCVFACREALNAGEHMRELQNKVIDEVPGKWRDIAIQLKFTLNAVEKIKGDSDEERCLTMLGAWLRRNKHTGDLPRTRGSLYDALVNANCRDEADNLLE